MKVNLLLAIFIVMAVLTINVNLVQAHHENAPPGMHVMPNSQVMKNSDMITGNVVGSQDSNGIGIVGWGIIIVLVIIIIWYLSKKIRFSSKN